MSARARARARAAASSRSASGARVDGQPDAPGDDVRCRRARPRGARRWRRLPSIPRAASRTRSTNSAAVTSASSRPSIGVVPAWPAVPSNTTSPPRQPTIPVTTPSGAPRCPSSTGPCSTCTSRKRARERIVAAARPAPEAPALLVAERDDGQRSACSGRPRDRLDPRDDAERAVVPSALGNPVECDPSNLGPSRRGRAAADHVAGRVALDRRPGLSIHRPRARVPRAPRRPAGAVRARPAADRVELLEPLQGTHPSRS